MVIDALKKSGYTVAAVTSDGKRCVELYRELKPDLVILDLAISDMTGGMKILEILRAENPPARVMMMCALGREFEAKECVRNGAAGFLMQPCKLSRLLETVNELIGQ